MTLKNLSQSSKMTNTIFSYLIQYLASLKYKILAFYS
nr:MAG TPA: hypothetical protein [Caudoviricetes sp.]